MQYTILELPEKTVVGLACRTNNHDPQMGAQIGALWAHLFGGVYERITHKIDAHTIGLYNDYADGADGDYTVTVGCAVSEAHDQPPETVTTTIPAGRYAKFEVTGDQVTAVARAWEAIWQLPLARTYTGDYEEYIAVHEDGQCDIQLYIAIE